MTDADPVASLVGHMNVQREDHPKALPSER